MNAYRIGAVILVGSVAVIGYVFWPRQQPPDRAPDPGAGAYMLRVREVQERNASGLIGGALGMAAVDGPADPWWSATHPKASASTR